MKNVIVAAAILALQPVAALAQSAPLLVGQPSANMLRAGTAIQLRTVTELTTNGKKLKVGDRFDLETSEPLMLAGQVVIPSGSRAVGEVTGVRNKGMWGKSGNIDARLLFVRAGEQQIRITGSLNDKGKTGTAGVVASVALIPVAGFFVTGTSAVIAPGTQATGYLESDLPVQFAQGVTATPAMVVPAAPLAAPTMAVVSAEPAVVLAGAK